MPVRIQCFELPDLFVALEHGLGDGFEELFVEPEGRFLSTPDSQKHFCGHGPRLRDAHAPGIANDLPDALSPVPALDEEAFPARRQRPDSETIEPVISDLADPLAGSERIDALR